MLGIRLGKVGILKGLVEDLSENCVKISRPYILYFPINKPSKSVTFGPGRFIILNDSSSPKIVIQIYFKKIRFFGGFRVV